MELNYLDISVSMSISMMAEANYQNTAAAKWCLYEHYLRVGTKCESCAPATCFHVWKGVMGLH